MGPSKHTGGSRSTVEHAIKLDKMEDVMAAALSSLSNNSQEVQELDINCLYYDVVGGEKKYVMWMDWTLKV